jgi:uncharacterized protein (DUF305 family)
MLPAVNTFTVPELQEEAVPGSAKGTLTPTSGASRLADVRPRHVVTPVVPLIAVALCLGGCRAESPATPAPPVVSSAATFGGTDRAWVEINIAMGEELLPLLELAPARSRDAEVKALAADAKTLHQKELATLYALHDAAGLPAENPHKGMPMPGMVTPEQLAEASASTGPAFDKLLLRHLGAHLAQGVRLATSETTSGVEPRARALAAQMITERSEMADRVRGTGT